MSITRTGIFFEDVATGSFQYGDGNTGGIGSTGTLSVTAGSQFIMTSSDPLDDPQIGVGYAGSIGTVNVTGTGSLLQLTSNGVTTEGGWGFIGHGPNSGTGTLNVSAGGTFRIQDTVGGATSGNEQLFIGTEGSSGFLNVDSATVEIRGTGSNLEIGNEFGSGSTTEGTATFTNGSNLLVEELTGDGSKSASIKVGNDTKGVGTLTLDNSTGAVMGIGSSYVELRVGNGGTGTLNLNGTSALTMNGGALSNFNGGGVGTSGGNGVMNVNDTAVLTINGGGGETYFNLGRDNGTAEVNVASGAQVNFIADSTSGMQIGRSGAGTIATYNNYGDLNISSTVDGAYLNIGREGSNGTLNNFGTVDLVGSTDAGMHVGRGGTGGGTGTFSQDGGNITFDAGNTAYFGVGAREFSDGTVLMENSSLLQMNGAVLTDLNVGNDNGAGGGIGIMEVESGSTVDLNSQGDTFINVGRSSLGTLRFNDATFDVDSSSELGFQVGVDYGNGAGTGLVEFLNGSVATFDAVSTPFIGGNAGFGAGSSGTINIVDSSVSFTNNNGETFYGIGRSGGAGDLSLNNSSYIHTGTAWSGIQFGRDAGSIGNLSMTNSSTMEFNSGYGAYFTFGRDGGTSTADIDASVLRFSGTGSSLADPLFGQPTDTGGNIGREGTGTVNITNGSLVEIIDSGLSAYFNVGRGVSASGTFNIDDSDLNVSATGALGSSFLNIGRDGAIGSFNADNSTITVNSANDFATFRVGMDFGTPGAVGTAILENGTDVTVSGDTARVSVGYTGTSTGNLQVLSGSQIAISDTGGFSEGSTFAIGYQNDGNASGSVVIDGIGSRVFGSDITVVGYRDPDGILTGAGDGLLTITNDGELESDTVLIGEGGSLVLGDSTIEVGTTGTVFGQTAGFYLSNGNMRVLADGTANIVGNLTSIGTSTLTIEVSADGTSAGRVNVSGDVTSDMGFNFILETQAGYQFSTGDSYVLMTAAQFNLDGPAPVVTGQSADFAHYFYANGPSLNQISFTALNNGDGTGAADFDFLDFTSQAAELDYDTDARTGYAGNSENVAVDDIGGALSNVDRVYGTNFADELTAFGSQGIELWGRGGTDVITSGAGDDILNGGSGNDTLDGGSGGDTLDGGSNGLVGDTVTYANSNGAVNVRLLQDTATGGHANGDELDNIENLIGSVHNDILFGDVQDNDLQGGDGDDNLNGSNGDDTLNGGADDDRLTGGQGADDLDGGDGTGDEARYATSNEAVVIDLAADTATGGHADGDELDNIENLFGSGFGDTLTGDSQDNRLDGFNGNDTLIGGDGADFLFGGTGSDTADYTDSGMTAVTVKLNTFSGVGGTAEGDELRAIENVIGSAAGDTINGSTGTNTLDGASGDDTLNGLNGNDFLYGGDNDDTLIGGRGGDLIDGGDGIDTARYANSDGLIRIDLGAGTTGGAGHAFNDTLVDIENIFGSAFNDVITGDDGINDLNGYNGNDRLNGGLGDDVLTGGSGNDRFVFTDLAFGQDTITDFTNGQDKLDFTALGLTASDFTITQVGNDTMMTLNSDTNQTIVLEDTIATTIDNGDFF